MGALVAPVDQHAIIGFIPDEMFYIHRLAIEQIRAAYVFEPQTLCFIRRIYIWINYKFKTTRHI